MLGVVAGSRGAVSGSGVHGDGNGMGDEQHLHHPVADPGPQRLHGCYQGVHVGRDETVALRIGADLVDDHARYLLHDSGQVLPVLTAGGIAGIRGGGQRHHSVVTVTVQGGDGLGEERGPVAVPDHDGTGAASSFQLRREGVAERLVLLVDGGATTEELVMLGDLQQAFVRHAPSRGGVAHEGQHVLRLTRTPVGGQQHGRIRAQDITHLISVGSVARSAKLSPVTGQRRWLLTSKSGWISMP